MFPCLCIWLRLQGQFGSVSFGLHVICIFTNAPWIRLGNHITSNRYITHKLSRKWFLSYFSVTTFSLIGTINIIFDLLSNHYQIPIYFSESGRNCKQLRE